DSIREILRIVQTQEKNPIEPPDSHPERARKRPCVGCLPLALAKLLAPTPVPVAAQEGALADLDAFVATVVDTRSAPGPVARSTAGPGLDGVHPGPGGEGGRDRG
ncbi:MAG: hypothetical protein ACWGSQ_20340, partial [Longimicrobiales bacterium]